MFLKSSKLYDLIYCNLKDYKSESENIKIVILQKKHTAKTILNVACGTGEHDKFLKKDFDVDGLDINQTFLDISKSKNKSGNYYLGDMRNFSLEKKYDVILCLFASIGYLKSVDELKQAVFSFSTHLNARGLILIEPWVVPEQAKNGTPHMLSFSKENYKICRMCICETKEEISKLYFHYLFGDNNGIRHITENQELRFFSAEEVSSAFESVNLELIFDPIGLTGRGLYLARLNSEVETIAQKVASSKLDLSSTN